jgi:hypothetical protein
MPAPNQVADYFDEVARMLSAERSAERYSIRANFEKAAPSELYPRI